MSDSTRRPTLLWAATANGLVLLPLLAAAAISAWQPEGYYRAVQEDGFLEWASAWAFAAAGLLWLRTARDVDRQRLLGRLWCVGVALFCVVVALEEISWGQRLLGYRPPEYFLAENFQQEFNLHNVTEKSTRKLGLKAVILGFGVGLPLLALLPAARRQVERWGLRLPPLVLVPAFGAVYAAYEAYPWKFTGEWVECGLGLGFLAAAAGATGARGPQPAAGAEPDTAPPAGSPPPPPPGPLLAVASAAVVLLAGASSAYTQHQGSGSSERVREARSELEALRGDFEHSGLETRCGVHRRLYTWVERSRGGALRRGAFAGLVAGGLPEVRAHYFLDPWNAPYWVRDHCGGPRRQAWIYSTGPNRRRDSTRSEILGDDLAVRLR